MKVYYTYLWLRNDGTPYYVGKAANLRRTRAPHRVGRCPPIDRILIQEYLSEEDALEAEKFLISYYGREDLGLGRLLNLTDGGEQGPTGIIVPEHVRQKFRGPKSEEVRKAIAEGVAKRGKWQKPHTELTKQKISQAKKGCPCPYRPPLGVCPYRRPLMEVCQRGHIFLLQNIGIQKHGRFCRLCHNLRQREYYERKSHERNTRSGG